MGDCGSGRRGDGSTIGAWAPMFSRLGVGSAGQGPVDLGKSPCALLREDPPLPKHSRHLNATRHGLRAASLVLPWEDPGAFARLREDLVAEHTPQGRPKPRSWKSSSAFSGACAGSTSPRRPRGGPGFREMLTPYNGQKGIRGASRAVQP